MATSANVGVSSETELELESGVALAEESDREQGAEDSVGESGGEMSFRSGATVTPLLLAELVAPPPLLLRIISSRKRSMSSGLKAMRNRDHRFIHKPIGSGPHVSCHGLKMT